MTRWGDTENQNNLNPVDIDEKLKIKLKNGDTKDSKVGLVTEPVKQVSLNVLVTSGRLLSVEEKEVGDVSIKVWQELKIFLFYLCIFCICVCEYIVCVHIWMGMCMFVSICMYACMYAFVWACICTYVLTHVCTCVVKHSSTFNSSAIFQI